MDSGLAVLILAAGESKRLGTTKQLLKFHSHTLLEHVIENARAVSEKIFVVLGAHAESIEKKINLSGCLVVTNTNWKNGMGSSIAAGVQSITSNTPDCKKILVLLTDQPKVSRELLTNLVDTHHHESNLITACNYGSTYGVPAIFDLALFSELKALKGVKGAKSIIKSHFSKASFIDFPEGQIDIDTPSDLKFLNG